MEIIHPEKNQRLYGTIISILYMMGEIVLIFNISGSRAIIYYFVFTKTLDMVNEKYKLA